MLTFGVLFSWSNVWITIFKSSTGFKIRTVTVLKSQSECLNCITKSQILFRNYQFRQKRGRFNRNLDAFESEELVLRQEIVHPLQLRRRNVVLQRQRRQRLVRLNVNLHKQQHKNNNHNFYLLTSHFDWCFRLN